MKRSGWFKDSHRHYLAAKGIKTRRYNATISLKPKTALGQFLRGELDRSDVLRSAKYKPQATTMSENLAKAETIRKQYAVVRVPEFTAGGQTLRRKGVLLAEQKPDLVMRYIEDDLDHQIDQYELENDLAHAKDLETYRSVLREALTLVATNRQDSLTPYQKQALDRAFETMSRSTEDDPEVAGGKIPKYFVVERASAVDFDRRAKEARQNAEARVSQGASQ